MDADNIFWIILWIGIIIFSFVSAKNNKEKQARELKKLDQTISAAQEAVEQKPRKTKAKTENRITHKPKNQTALFDEGQRITNKQEIAATAINRPPAPDTTSKVLDSKEKLRNAIIFGEILAPKF